MKRSWIGLGLLVVLLVLGLVVTLVMTRIHDPIAEELEQASQSVLLGDWGTGDRHFQAAYGSWERWSHLRNTFADHNPTEEIDSLFAELQVYSTTREDAAFAAGCMELAKKVAAVGEAHELVWWNVL